MSGIVNGTSNFILTQISGHGKTYAAALAEAQHQGDAEADRVLRLEWQRCSPQTPAPGEI
ncbi:hypothetical protein JFU49_02200 [Pseudomonas sp. TH03]|nr:hypothetical protein [Pseudomonas sp. TH03]